jgi:hypothetical protein
MRAKLLRRVNDATAMIVTDVGNPQSKKKKKTAVISVITGSAREHDGSAERRRWQKYCTKKMLRGARIALDDTTRE